MTELQAKEKIQKLMAVANCSTTNPNEAATAKNMAAKVAEKNSLMTWFFLTFISAPSVKPESTKTVELHFYTINTDLFKAMIVTLITNMAANYFDCMIHDKGTKNFKAVSFRCTEDQFKAICNIGTELTKAFRKFRKSTNMGVATSRFKYYVLQGYMGGLVEFSESAQSMAYELGCKIKSELNTAKKGGVQ